ncbi:hypothetical protein JNB11_01280 [Kocuria palustris]|nr:hypothetical protein [Kocuria palustris]
MLLLYIGVYKAVYDYAAQAPEELSINEGDLLYLLETLDIDEWWKVKRRVVATGNEEVDEPEGLVPLNYIEPAGVMKQCVALYDYTKQTDEELSFKENDRFNIYDDADPDWLLAGDLAGKAYGFLPSNYVKMANGLFNLSQSELPPLPGSAAPAPSAPQVAAVNASALPPPPMHPSQTPLSQFQPPPLHILRDATPAADPTPLSLQPPAQQLPLQINGDDEAPPPMPLRPRSNTANTQQLMPSSVDDNTAADHTYDGDLFTWYIDEIDGRKKRSVALTVGPGFVRLKPNQKKLSKLRGGALTLDNEWQIRDLINYSQEKKHVFFEFKNPKALIELHAGSKDVAEAIMLVLGDFKGADLARGLREVAKASQTSTNAQNRKIGKLMYDFVSQGKDELGAKEGEEVYIINDVKLKEWWMCELVNSGRQGVIPLSYLEVVGTSNLDLLTNGARKRNESSLKKKRHRDRGERDRIRERDRRERERGPSHREDDKLMPNYHRVRTWIDLLGLFKVEAEFLGCVDGKVHLHKTNGVKIAVLALKLSVEDLEYVEKVTGTLLELYKEEVIRANEKRDRALRRKLLSGGHYRPSSTAAINDIPPPQPQRPNNRGPLTNSAPGESDYDWFEFFLLCGVDIGNCQRYALNFSKERMDENVLEDISPQLLRTLGLREGDIIRVMKHLDQKYGRKHTMGDAGAASTSGGLFTEAGGALKNNSLTLDIPRVDGAALPSPNKAQPNNNAPPPQAPRPENDDAWVVKPAARSLQEDLLSKQTTVPQPQTPQYTGSLQDLMNIKPHDPKVPPPNQNQAPAAPALVPKQPPPRPTAALPNFEPVSAQKTGQLVPVTTGGLLPAQPTGFLPIQPTGFMPIQPTGGQSYVLLPVVTGPALQKTGGAGMPTTTFGGPSIVPLQTGTLTMPATLFGGLAPSLAPSQPTGGMPQTLFGATVPQQKTGPLSAATTGGIGNAFVPQLTFGKQITGGFMAQPQQQLPPQTLFGANPTTNFPQQMNQMTNMFGQANLGQPQPQLGQQPTNMFGLPQQPTQPALQPQFGQQLTLFGGLPQTQPQQPQFGGLPQTQPQFGQMPQPLFGAMPQAQPQFGGMPQPQFGGAQPQFGGQAPPMTLFGQAPVAPQPVSLFGQQPAQFEGFGQLQSQPTGLGFGNSPLLAQQTGKSHANLAAATPDNPFGFMH